MIESFSVAAFVLSLLYVVVSICHRIAWWAERTPRSGYLIVACFALFILVRSLP
jgi:hypothetical protein